MLGSECDLKMYVRNLGYPFPTKIGAQEHFSRRLRNLTANLTAYIFGVKHVMAWKLQGVFYIAKKFMNFGLQMA